MIRYIIYCEVKFESNDSVIAKVLSDENIDELKKKENKDDIFLILNLNKHQIFKSIPIKTIMSKLLLISYNPYFTGTSFAITTKKLFGTQSSSHNPCFSRNSFSIPTIAMKDAVMKPIQSLF